MKQDRYAQTVEYLYSLLPAYQQVGGKALKKDLRNIQALCEALGMPQMHFKSVLIAGTNGKGSVSAMLFSILRAAGYATGMYSSPHLLEFNERIRVNGDFISNVDVVEFVETHQKLIEKIRPSFFEFTVAMAFAYFAQKEVEWAIVEVGLGGRLDSTNILQQELSLITNISLDHQHILGNTLQEIASEKAGIIKKGIPTLIGETQADTTAVFLQQAWELQAPIIFADKHWQVQWEERKINANQFSVSTPPPNWEQTARYTLDLNGDYQLKNIPLIMEACRQLQAMGVHISTKAIDQGLAHTQAHSGLRGRMEVLTESPFIVVDTGHNEAGVKAAWEQIKKIPSRQVHIIWGMVADKDHKPILRLLPKDANYYFVQPGLQRAFPSKELAILAKEQGLKGPYFSSTEEGLNHALQELDSQDTLWIGGSTFVVAEALVYWREYPFTS